MTGHFAFQRKPPVDTEIRKSRKIPARIPGLVDRHFHLASAIWAGQQGGGAA